MSVINMHNHAAYKRREEHKALLAKRAKDNKRVLAEYRIREHCYEELPTVRARIIVGPWEGARCS